MDRMEYVFSSLVEYLQIDNAYNIFILNPKKDDKRIQYGYRWVILHLFNFLLLDGYHAPVSYFMIQLRS